MSSDLDVLVGTTIAEVNVSDGMNDIQFVTTNKQKFHFQCYGECCAYPFIETLENVKDIIGQEITEISADYKDIEEEYDGVTNCVFYTIKSLKGRCFIDFRVSHNGYYSGDLRLINQPYDNQYNKEPKWHPASDK